MTILEIFGAYIFYYPIIMSLIWMIGGIYYHFRYERNQPEYPALTAHPLISVLIPARNEALNIRETVEAVMDSSYPNYEVIVINDASTDETESILRQLVAEYPQVRLLNLTVNQGKATALNYGFLMSKGEIIAVACMLQFAVSLLVDNKYDKRLWLTYFWVIWYPVIYWIFNAMTVLVATPRGLTKKFGKAAIWASPDRGLRAVTHDAQQK